MAGRRFASCVTLAALIPGFFARDLLPGELQEHKRAVVLRAVKLAVEIEPPPTVEIISLAHHLGPLDEAQLPWTETLFRALRQWAAQTESPQDYQDAGEAADILYQVYSTYPYSAEGLFRQWPDRPEMDGAYLKFVTRCEGEKQRNRADKSPLAVLVESIPLTNVNAWVGAIWRLNFSSPTEARAAFERAVAVCETGRGAGLGTIQILLTFVDPGWMDGQLFKRSSETIFISQGLYQWTSRILHWSEKGWISTHHETY